MERRILRHIVLLSCIFICGNGYSETKEHAKLWNTAIIQGPITKDEKILFYLQPQLVLIDNKYKFDNGLIYLGVGYQVATNVTIWLINGLSAVKQESTGNWLKRDTLRQQLNWVISDTEDISVTSTSRLEQRKQFSESQINLRFRQNVTLRIPIKIWKDHSIVIFDEGFFNLNHPKWISGNSLFVQNRAFIGLGTQFTKAVSLDSGYMNQYRFRETNEIDNVLFLRVNVTLTSS